LTALRAFEAAARWSSFKHAADELALTPTAVSHQIRALEDRLGVRLFERRTRQVVLTEAGRRLGAGLHDAFDRMADAVDAVQPRRASVTITTTPAFAAQWLLPRWHALATAHPHIDLRLHAGNALVDLLGGAADLAIRYGRGGPYAGLQSTLLLADRFMPIASPSLRLRSARDLAKHALIHFEWLRADAGHPSWDTWFARAGVKPSGLQDLRFTDESHAIQSAVAGQGVALLSEVLVRSEVRRGLLHMPFGPILEGMAYCLVRPARPSKPEVDEVARWIGDQARDAPA
jgi:LysR family glycine cleavage system transcriptional activator